MNAASKRAFLTRPKQVTVPSHRSLSIATLFSASWTSAASAVSVVTISALPTLLNLVEVLSLDTTGFIETPNSPTVLSCHRQRFQLGAHEVVLQASRVVVEQHSLAIPVAEHPQPIHLSELQKCIENE